MVKRGITYYDPGCGCRWGTSSSEGGRGLVASAHGLAQTVNVDAFSTKGPGSNEELRGMGVFFQKE